MIKLSKKSEWFKFPSPICEPTVKWKEGDIYHIERLTYENGDIVWFGINTNWKKEKGGSWTVLSTNYDAKPLEKYLPEIVYGEDRTYWKKCNMPFYERTYIVKIIRPNKTKFPSYCCQNCGEPIGWLGRFIEYIYCGLIKHECKNETSSN